MAMTVTGVSGLDEDSDINQRKNGTRLSTNGDDAKKCEANDMRITGKK